MNNDLFKPFQGVRLHQKISFTKYFNKVHHNNKSLDGIFMPGCSLLGYNPKLISKIMEHLNKDKNIALYTGCCGKPSKDIKDIDGFNKYNKMMEYELKSYNCPIIIGCENCFNELTKNDLSITSIWSYLVESRFKVNEIPNKDISLKLPCKLKKDSDNYNSIFDIINMLNLNVLQTHTKCCGSGIIVDKKNSHIKESFKSSCIDSLTSEQIVSCCGECRNVISKGKRKSYHLLDFIFQTQNTKHLSTLSIWRNKIINKKGVK